jgi:hypothetical protein
MDRASRWETEALREGRDRTGSRPQVSQHAQRTPTPEGGEFVTLREAEEATGIPVGTLRKWARRDAITSFLESDGELVLRFVSLPDVRRRAIELGRDLDEGAHAEDLDVPTEGAPTPPTSPGTMIVPVDAWNKMITQLGNLHEAGRELAEARERAAKAETEAKFLRERLAEMREQEPSTEPAAPEAPQPADETEETPQPTEARWRTLYRRMWSGRR